MNWLIGYVVDNVPNPILSSQPQPKPKPIPINKNGKLYPLYKIQNQEHSTSKAPSPAIRFNRKTQYQFRRPKKVLPRGEARRSKRKRHKNPNNDPRASPIRVSSPYSRSPNKLPRKRSFIPRPGLLRLRFRSQKRRIREISSNGLAEHSQVLIRLQLQQHIRRYIQTTRQHVHTFILGQKALRGPSK